MSVNRIDKLTPEQQAAMPGWAQRWIDIGLNTQPADREAFETHARRCYEAAGIEWPGRVVWVSSPLVMCLAGPIATHLLSQDRAVYDAVHDAVDVDMAANGAVNGELTGFVGDAARGAVAGAVAGAVRDAVRDAVRGAVADAVDGAVSDAVRGAVNGAVADAVADAVDDAVRGAVYGAVAGAVDGAVSDAVRGAVAGAVAGAVDGAVSDAVRGAVRGAVNGAVRNSWNNYIGRGWWWLTWQSRSSFYREFCDLDLPGDLWDRSRAAEGTTQTSWAWWPHSHFVIACDFPSEIHREQVSPAGWGSHRLHRADGPAVRFRDGWSVYAIHGVRVPAEVVEQPESITVDRILTEPNVEVRRVMIDVRGWDWFTQEANLTLVDQAPDPGNPGETLDLYDLPAQVYDEPVRVVLCTNASPERDGTRRRFGLTVPADCNSAIGAAAWMAGVDEDTYSRLERAT